ncbi:MAG: NPCBM/NEW2 domain-containing protein, partial [Eubacteriales bacterium]
MKHFKFRAVSILLSASILVALIIASQVVMAEETDSVYVSDLECAHWEMIQSSSDNPASPYRPSFNCNEQGGTLTIAGVEYEKGLRTHPDQTAPAVFVYDISTLNYKYFSATVGKDSLGGEGLVRFVVCVDDQEVATSRELAFGESQFIQCSVEGGSKLSLYVYNVDGCVYDSSAWGDARLTQTEVVHETEETDSVYVSDLECAHWEMIQSSSDNPASPY